MCYLAVISDGADGMLALASRRRRFERGRPACFASCGVSTVVCTSVVAMCTLVVMMRVVNPVATEGPAACPRGMPTGFPSRDLHVHGGGARRGRVKADSTDFGRQYDDGTCCVGRGTMSEGGMMRLTGGWAGGCGAVVSWEWQLCELSGSGSGSEQE